MELNVSNKLIDVKLIETIKILYDNYIKEYDSLDENGSFTDHSNVIRNCTKSYINKYLYNFYSSILDKSITDNNIDYITVLTQIYKGSLTIFDVISLFQNTLIKDWSIKDNKLKISIYKITTTDATFTLDQFIKSIYSLLLVSNIDLEIYVIESIIETEYQSVTSNVSVNLQSRYNCVIKEITEEM